MGSGYAHMVIKPRSLTYILSYICRANDFQLDMHFNASELRVHDPMTQNYTATSQATGPSSHPTPTDMDALCYIHKHRADTTNTGMDHGLSFSNL